MSELYKNKDWAGLLFAGSVFATAIGAVSWYGGYYKGRADAAPQKISVLDGNTAVPVYSPAKTYGNLVFTAGQIALDQNRKLVGHGDIQVEAKQALQNLQSVLNQAGSSMGQVLKITVYLTDMKDYEVFNQEYMKFFSKDVTGQAPPARSCFAVKGLPLGAKVEIEGVAVKSPNSS